MAPRISVVGCGYLGATHAVGMAELGFDVVGLDVDEAKVTALQEAQATVLRAGPGALAPQARGVGTPAVHDLLREAAEFADVHFLCVSTPQRDGEFAVDVSLRGRGGRVAGAAAAPAVPGRRASPRCRWARRPGWPSGSRDRPAGDEAVLAWNPEFLREGYAIEDTLRRAAWCSDFRRRHRRRAEAVLRRGLRGADRRWAHRSSSVTWPPRSWRSPRRTRSWPRRSRSSTRWPSCARPPAPT